MISASDPLTTLPGIGKKWAEKLATLGLHTLHDCSWYFPLRYEDHAHVIPIQHLQEGQAALICGTVLQSTLVGGRAKPRLIVILQDGTGICQLPFFHYATNYQTRFFKGQTVLAFGTPYYKKNGWTMAHPECSWVKKDETPILPDTLLPVYPTTQGVSQGLLRKVILGAVTAVTPQLSELLPPELQTQFAYTTADAVRWLHQPPVDTSDKALQDRQHPAFIRLIVEEFLAHQWALRQPGGECQKPALACPPNSPMIARFIKNLPFTLTSAQQRVWQELETDLNQIKPMRRLLQGDVGSGKTVVAALALLSVAHVHLQSVLMVPTEVLAEQHYQKIHAWFAPLGIRVGLLIGAVKGRARQTLLDDLKTNQLSILIGTHAVFQEAIQFSKLGLVVVDEQHRFGVHQRFTLLEKGQAFTPHQLLMTATPIPRTLAMAIYGDMTVSRLEESPPGRQPIQTVVMPSQKRAAVIEKLATWLKEGRQCYWICPLIEESLVLQCQAAESTWHTLQQQLPEARIGLVHGRFKSAEKQRAMQAFSAHQTDILVATTVVEVGIDVPNASLIIIDNAERLGLAQLHQLRGRVGRGAEQSFCVLLYQSPLSLHARERLDILKTSQDGFWIAEKDFQLRGSGEWLGTKQTGVASYKIAQLETDGRHLETSRHMMIQCPPWATGEALIERWLGRKTQYQEV